METMEKLRQHYVIHLLAKQPTHSTDTANSDKMEMLELNSANQTTVNSNGTYNIISGQQPQQPNQQQINLGPPHMYRNHQQTQQQQQQQPQGLRYINNQKVPKHRELPVDVPDSFVGIAKQSPRYPPPKPHRQVSPSMQINNLTTFNNNAPNLNNMPYNSNNQSNNCANQQTQPPAAPPIAQSTATNLMTHNSSLRSSIKLKQLEKSRGNQQYGNYPVGQMQPAINQAFELNEDAVPNQKHQQQQHQQLQQQSQQSHQQQALRVKQAMPDLCSIYNRLQRNLNGDFAEATGDAKFVKLLSIYNTIVQTHNKQFKIPNLTSRCTPRVNSHGQRQEPITYKVSDLLQSVRFTLREEQMTSDLVELLSLLCKHEVDGVCSAFDRIAQSFEFAKSASSQSPSAATTSSPTSELLADSNNGGVIMQQQTSTNSAQFQAANQRHQDIPMYPYQTNQMDDYDYAQDQIQMDIENNLYQNSLHLPMTDIDLNDGTCRTVCIQKNSNQALGATIKNEDGGSVIIGRIICGGAAYMSGLLNEGDEILEVNGVQMRGKNINEVIEILNSMEDTLKFSIISRNYKPIQRPTQEKIHVKTFFKYDGDKDRYIPCKELSLSFEQGEILIIIDQSDPRWWQAKREGDSDCHLASLIPSLNFLKEREKESDQEEFTNAYLKQREKKTLVSKLFNCPKGSSPRRRKKPPNIPFGPQETIYYEEVTAYYPNKIRRRPIILVGPKMIGQREIWTKLLKDTNRFSSAVSHTSRPMQPHEQNGVDFHFVSRSQFEADINDGKFIEFGQYQNQYYGTSLEAIRTIVYSKKTCVQLVNTPSIFNFRQGRAGAELKPFFVFVKPDDSHPEKLRNIVAQFSQPKSNLEENIKAIKAEVELIETHYLPYFDMVLTVSDIERAYQELLHKIDHIDKEPQWIPAFWLETCHDNQH